MGNRMPTARTRERQSPAISYSGKFLKHTCVPAGHYTGVSTTTSSGTAYIPFKQTTTDVSGNYPNPNAFNTSTIRHYGGKLMGYGQCPVCGIGCGVTGTLYAEGASAGLSHEPVTLNNVSYASIAARTTPNRPDVDIPVNLLELRDIPKLVQLAGRSLLGKVAGANLCYNFGWAPLLGDLAKLWEFSKYYDRRVRNIRGLSKANGIRRKITLDEKTAVRQRNVNVSTIHGVWFTSPETTVTNVKRWASIRWKYKAGYVPPPPGSSAEHWMAVQAVLGLHPSSILSAAWEAIPFSWLADWFGNIGDHLMLTRNGIPVVPSGFACVMTHSKTLRILGGVTSQSMPHVSFEQMTSFLETKNRTVVTGLSLEASMPEFNLWQLGILGSLTVLKAEAWSGKRIPKV